MLPICGNRESVPGVLGSWRLIGGRVPVLLKWDGSRPNCHIQSSPLRYRIASRCAIPLSRVVLLEVPLTCYVFFKASR
jgi:hypothetical protein